MFSPFLLLTFGLFCLIPISGCYFLIILVNFHLAPSSPFLFVCEAISITRVLFMERISAPKNLISYHPQTSKTNIQACRWKNLWYLYVFMFFNDKQPLSCLMLQSHFSHIYMSEVSEWKLNQRKPPNEDLWYFRSVGGWSSVVLG